MFWKIVDLILNFLFQLHLPILRRILRNSIKCQGNVSISLPNGEKIQCGNDSETDQKATLILHKPGLSLLRMVPDAKMGFSEAFMNGEIEAEPSLQALISILMKNENSMKTEAEGTVNLLLRTFYTGIQYIGRFVNYLLHLWRENTIIGSQKNISEHYDVGNEFYSLFLDDSMTYSCGYYKEKDGSLFDAQMNKFDMILERIDVTSQDHILEIGCGWAPFAVRAVYQTGCKWTGITISKEQLTFGVNRIAELGLENKIELKLQDYRMMTGRFDKIVSIEMLEHVGHDYMAVYFDIIKRSLKPGGKACIQVMTWPDETYESYRKSSDFFKKHLAPGLNLPSISAIKAALPVGLEWAGHISFGTHYPKIMLAWIEKMEEHKGDILKMGYSEYFYRKWLFFFRSCVALFGDGYCDVIHFVLERKED